MNSISHSATKQPHTYLKNPAALYKIFKDCDHPGKLYNEKFRDVIVRYQIKFLKIVSYIFYFNQRVFKSSFKKWD